MEVATSAHNTDLGMKVFLAALATGVALLFAAPQSTSKKVELAHPFYWAASDPLRGDWQGEGGYVAQVVRAEDKILSVPNLIPDADDVGKYQANIFRKFDVPNDKPLAVLHGVLSGSTVTFSGDGWSGTIANGHFKGNKGDEAFDLQHVTRMPPSMGAKPPAGAVRLI